MMDVDVFDPNKKQPESITQGQQIQERGSFSLVAPTAINEMERAQIDVQIQTAKHFPRTVSTAIEKAKTLACADTIIADECTYGLKRGKKRITGPTIRLAEIMATSWGNLRYAGRTIAIEDRRVVAQGVCHDLESNAAASVEVSRSIVDKYGKRYGDDMIRVTSQAAIAIAIRNAIFKIIPGGYVGIVQRAAQAVARGEVMGLIDRTESAIAFFVGLGATETKVLAAIDLTKREDITWEHIDQLIQYAASIKTGETSIAELFGATPATEQEQEKKPEGGETPNEVEPGKGADPTPPPTPPTGQQSFGKRAEREATEEKEKEEKKQSEPGQSPPAPSDESNVNLQF